MPERGDHRSPESRGLVASGHARVSEAAAEVLRSGGNAFDAAVAGGFASSLAEPALTSLGGGGFLLARRADGRAQLFDFFVDTPGRELGASGLSPHFVPVTVHFPGSDQVFNAGLGSIAVPGNLAGYLHAHERLGRLPLRDVLQPAVQLARDGVRVNESQAYFLGLLRPIMTLTEAGRALYAPRGRLLAQGDLLVNPDLAGFLESLGRDREGLRDFYSGGLADRIARDMRDGQGLLGREDLSHFRVIERRPLSVDYRGHRLLTNPGPAFGGPLLALSLQLLEQIPPAAGPTSAAHLLALVAVLQEVDAQRAGALSSTGEAAPGEQRKVAERLRRFSRGTTHISVLDAEGNAASMTTSNGEGSGYVAPGTGIMLNNMLGEDDLHPHGFHAAAPGQRVASGMSPCVLLREERVRAVLGSGGSKRIRTALLQVISLLTDFDFDVRAAVDQPRLHWDGQQVQVEPGFPAEALRAVARMRPVNEWRRSDVYFGGVHAVASDTGCAGDARRGGHALVVETAGQSASTSPGGG